MGKSKPSIKLASKCDKFLNKIFLFFVDCFTRRLHQVQVILNSIVESILNETISPKILLSNEDVKTLEKRIEFLQKNYEEKMKIFQKEIKKQGNLRAEEIIQCAINNLDDKLINPTVSRILNADPQNPRELENILTREVAYTFERFLRWYALNFRSDNYELEFGNDLFLDLKQELLDLRGIINPSNKNSSNILIPALIIGTAVTGFVLSGTAIVCAVAVPPFGFGIITAITATIAIPAAALIGTISAIKLGHLLSQWLKFQFDKKNFLQSTVSAMMKETISKHKKSHINNSKLLFSSIFEPIQSEINQLQDGLEKYDNNPEILKSDKKNSFIHNNLDEIKTFKAQLSLIDITFIDSRKIKEKDYNLFLDSLKGIFFLYLD